MKPAHGSEDGHVACCDTLLLMTCQCARGCCSGSADLEHGFPESPRQEVHQPTHENALMSPLLWKPNQEAALSKVS